MLDDDVADVRLAFASSRRTNGPPAREHGTACRTQFEQGDCSSHYANAISISRAAASIRLGDLRKLTLTCLRLH